MVSITNLSVEFSARPLFRDMNFVINPNDKIALTGKNGAGKSTLLKIIAGIENPTSGSVGMPDDLTIGYLPQQMEVADSCSVIDEVKKVCASNHEQPEDIGDMARMEGEIEKTLLGLGFKRSDFQRPTSEFSGGWRMRIELAKILLRRPDVLLLDEPTNHLDIESIEWLETFLKRKAKAVLVVSHDRAFLDNVTNRTIEISCGKMYDYKVSYTKFTELRRERVEQQMRAYENQQKQIADIKDFIERFRYKATKAVQVQSRIKQLEKIVPIEVDEVDKSRLRMKFPPAPRSGDFPLIIENVGKAYGDHQVFDHAEFTLRRGEKVAFVGRNGEGKSTLVKCIMGEIPYTGNLKIGHNVKIGYFAQNQAQLLDGEITVFDTIDRVATGDIRTKIRDILGAFMFGGEASDKKVKVLSGGEKTRLAMIKLLLEPVNLLILDEPTNHLDMKSKDILKDAIRDFDGTVIVVSHDRDFLDGLVDKVYEFSDGRVRENLGGIYDFLNKLHSERGEPTEIRAKASEAPKVSEEKEKRKKSYAEIKEQEKILRKARKQVEKAEEEISRLEARQAELESQLSEGNASPEILAEYAEISKKTENAMSVWELAQEEADRLEQQFNADK